MTCQITGVVVTPDGAAFASDRITFKRIGGVAAYDTGTGTPVIVPDIVEAATDASGNISVALYPGRYSARAGWHSFRVGVPEAAAADFSTCVDLFPKLTATVVQAVMAARADALSAEIGAQAAQTASELARDRSQEWAENPEDLEIDPINLPGSYSALHWSAKADDAAQVAQGYADAAGLSAIDAANSAIDASGFADDAENSAIAAASSAANAATAVTSYSARYLDDVAAVLADTSIDYGVGAGDVSDGDYIRTRAEGFSYEVAASGASDHDITTAGGVKLYALPTSDGAYNVLAFGAVGDGVANDAPALNQVMAATGRHIIVPPGTYLCEDTLRIRSGTHLDLHAEATIVHDAPTFCLLLNGPYGDPAYALGYDGDGDLHISGGTWDMSPRTAALQLGEAIGIAHAENVMIENARFENNHNDHFIEINSTRNCTIRNCTFDTTTTTSPGTRECINVDYSSAAGFPHFGGYDDTPCDGVLIDNCRFLNGDVAVGSHSAPAGAIDRHQRITVRDCFVDTMASAGIDIRFWNLRNSGIWRTQIAGVPGANDYRGLAVVDGRYVFQVEDDGVAVIPLAAMFGSMENSPQGVLLVSAESNVASAPRGLYWARAQSGSESISRIATGGLDTAVDLTTGVLTGTTGTDGRVTLSADGSGNFYIENRRGGSLRMTVMPALGPTGNRA